MERKTIAEQVKGLAEQHRSNLEHKYQTVHLPRLNQALSDLERQRSESIKEALRGLVEETQQMAGADVRSSKAMGGEKKPLQTVVSHAPIKVPAPSYMDLVASLARMDSVRK